MNTEQVLRMINDVIGRHRGDERELLEALNVLSEGWEMRLEELENEEEDAGG